ncbi:hypothetical protein N5079_26335 [Planotetraspora sp. A-T 1434]|uniref:hypothetical protein n=1 Tax=Planotetraspora sp. A-T 1434 TaxID=2979219 RepID=UPI0021BE6627|nr:hypothetical protein [Planotetraspora sp. A-T 1434]MCT9933737.1 hypothetical protein [Planotetraspora sp. A-T 1434]
MISGSILLGLALGVTAMLAADALKPEPARVSLDSAVCQGGLDVKKCADAAKAYKKCVNGQDTHYGKYSCDLAVKLHNECRTRYLHSEQACTIVAYDSLTCSTTGMALRMCPELGIVFLECLTGPTATPDGCHTSWNDLIVCNLKGGPDCSPLFPTPPGLPSPARQTGADISRAESA